ncbi:MAG TPA: hypothetical protein VIC33_16450, partial [Vicinamibacterales bacterium]|jgi:ABC-type transport system substrate-binding protein
VERLAVLVQQQLGELGIDFKLSSIPPNEFIRRVTSGQFEAAITDAIGGPEMSPVYWYWHSPLADNSGRALGFNFGDYRDARVDQALDDIRHANDDGTYRRAVSNLQNAIVDDPPAIFLAWSETFRAVSTKFNVPADSGDDVISSIRLWKPTPVAFSTP